MAQVETVSGPVDSGSLGVTLVHEHLRSTAENVREQFPHLYDEERENARAVEWVRKAMENGVRTIADPACMDLGRSVELARHVVDQTGIQLVMCTGIYGSHYTFLPKHFQNREVDYLADVFVHDIEQGIQGTGIKAAFIKCAADEPGVTPNVEKVHRAAARASLQTGRPIMAHSRPASGTGLEQMRVIGEEGVEPSKVQVAHTGDTDDLDYIERLLDTGCWIGMDRYGLDIFLPTEQRQQTVLALLEKGHADRMFLSQDWCSTIDWFTPELEEQLKPVAAPNWSMTFLFEQVIPELKECGMTGDQLDQMMVENPKRWLA